MLTQRQSSGTMAIERENHLMDAGQTNPELIRAVLAGLPVATAIATPEDTIAITRRDVVNAGLDTLAVTRWLQPLGGLGGVAYLKPASQRVANEPVRPALHPISYFAVPLSALKGENEEQQSAVA